MRAADFDSSLFSMILSVRRSLFQNRYLCSTDFVLRIYFDRAALAASVNPAAGWPARPRVFCFMLHDPAQPVQDLASPGSKSVRG